MIKNAHTSQAKFSAKQSKSLIIWWTILLAIIYLIYIKRQYADIFFESQFLHIDFLRDISQGKLTAKGFFTVFGEHLFPGYNFVLAANYYLFDLWGGFDGIVYAGSLLVTAITVIIVLYNYSSHDPLPNILIALVTAFLLLSPTNNAQWGMALAAAIGVMLFVISASCVVTVFDKNSKRLNPFAYITIILAILFFLGGYAVGAIGAILLLLIIFVAHNRMIDIRAIAILSTILVCMLLYISLVNQYGALLDNKPTYTTFNFQLIGRFSLLMIGSSLIGKAFFEQTQQLWPYYFCAVILVFWSVILFKEFIQRPIKQGMFVLAIATYSIINVAAVSLFRFKNGLDGALGQWYNVHTHFIAIAVCYYLLSSITERKFSLSLIGKWVSMGVILGFASAGYYCDWKKSKYVPDWKNQFVVQTPELLAFPDLILNQNDPLNTMLWNYSQAKLGVDFLYSKHLWIFKENTPVIFGLTKDGWMQADKAVMIICPSSSTIVRFHAWRPDGWKKSIVAARYTDKRDLLDVNNNEIQLVFLEGKRVALLDGSNFEESHPSTFSGDVRQLVAIIDNISCEARGGQENKNNLLTPLTELKVNNWGPRSTKTDTNPNKQPDGSMGIWIENSGTQGLGDVQVLFAGQPAKSTSVQENLITTAISSDQLTVAGDKEIVVKQLRTGKLFPVGVFKVIDK